MTCRIVSQSHFQSLTVIGARFNQELYLVISLLRSVTVPEPLRSTVMSADVSRRFRIFDMKSGSMGGGPAIEAADVIARLLRTPKLRPKSAKVPRRLDSDPLPAVCP